jgi:hypothetical protein
MTDAQQREASRQLYYKWDGKRLYQEKATELEKATSAKSGKAGEK